MADTRISDLTAGAAVSATDIFPNVQVVGTGPVKTTMSQAATFMWASPTLVTPTLGVASATSINKVALTTPASSATLTLADGTTLTQTKSTTLSGGVMREVLTANRTYYVRTDGSDSNTGLTNTSGGAFLTLQKAYNTIVTLDMAGYNCTIQLGVAGTYNTSGDNLAMYVAPEGGVIYLIGNVSSPGTYIVSSTSGNAIYLNCGTNLLVSGITVAAGGVGISVKGGGAQVSINGTVSFGACTYYHMYAQAGGYIYAAQGYNITGAAQSHAAAIVGGVVGLNAAATGVGTVTFTGAFAYVESCGIVDSSGWSISGGTITGSSVKVSATMNGVVRGGTYTNFPGTGVTQNTGGQIA